MALRTIVLSAAVCAVSAFAPPLSARPQSAVRAAVSMEEKAAKAAKEKPPPKPRVPGEGDPFGEVAQAFSEATKDGGASVEAPKGISDALVIDVYQPYIESMDEPWHATCRSSSVIGLDSLAAAKPATVLEAEAAEEASGKKKVGGDKPGWSGKRVVATVHDNSVRSELGWFLTRKLLIL